jgi:hypothetical protein
VRPKVADGVLIDLIRCKRGQQRQPRRRFVFLSNIDNGLLDPWLIPMCSPFQEAMRSLTIVRTLSGTIVWFCG